MDIVSTMKAKISCFFIIIFFLEFNCVDPLFGAGVVNENRQVDCSSDKVGYQIVLCNSSGLWTTIEDHCVLRVFQNLKDEANASDFFFSLP